MHVAARLRRAVEKHAVQDRARIDHDGMRHFERHTLIVAADQVDRAHQFLCVRVFEEKRKAFHRFVREAAAAGLFPREMLIKNPDFVSRSRKLLTAHCAGGSAADDGYF